MNKRKYILFYKKKEWVDFREKIIELDGNKCVRCKKTRKEGAILQVHHKWYFKGHKPWEYGAEDCETLCKGCHSAEHGIIPPKEGWGFIGQEELPNDEWSNCEYCSTDIRHVFTIFHDNWGYLYVGTDCCDNLTGTEEATNLRKRDEKKNRFLKSPRWEVTGKLHYIKQKSYHVYIYDRGGYFLIRINSKTSTTQYESLMIAKLKAYDVIEDGAYKEYLESKRKEKFGRERDWDIYE